jgi:hypothetical protein
MSRITASFRRLITLLPKGCEGILLGFLFFMATLGVFLAPQYGESWDERFNVNLGREELKAFYSTPDYQNVLPGDEKGPLFHMLAELATQLFQVLHPQWPTFIARHYIYFVTFLVGAYFLYRLCLRFMHPEAALVASQPLFFGHAFINPKDIPFMTFFIATMVLGMEMVDQLLAPAIRSVFPFSPTGLRSLRGSLVRDWGVTSQGRKIFLGITFGVALLVGLDVFVLHRVLLPLGLKIILAAYQGSGPAWLSEWFATFAENAGSVPLLDYLWNVTQRYWNVRIPLVVVALLPATVLLYKILGESVHHWLKPILELQPGTGHESQWQKLTRKWRAASVAQRIAVGILFIIPGWIALDLLVFHRSLLPQLLEQALLLHARAVDGIPVSGVLGLLLDVEKTSAVAFLWQVMESYWAVRLPIAFLILMPGAILLAGILKPTLHVWWQERHHRTILWAGAVLGLLISIRVVGAAAGGLISIYFLLRNRGRGLRPLIAYWSLAMLVAFITRPYFWNQTLQRSWRALTRIVTFEWRGSILYQGEVVRSGSVADSYTPLTILSRQLTEPMLVLILLGFGYLMWKLVRNTIDRTQVLILLLWILIPLALLQALPIQRYDNFRQFFFILAPTIVMVGMGLMWLFQRLPATGWKLLLVGICLLPSILGIVNLHPYEYIYYNSVSGGVQSAFGAFNLDYWCTSMRPAMEYINRTAKPGAAVALSQPEHVVWDIARADLKLQTLTAESTTQADYILICARQIPELESTPWANVVYAVERQGAVLSEVRAPSSR